MKFNKLIPELYVSNLALSLDFYTKVIGFNIDYERKENHFAFISLEGSQLMLQEVEKEWLTGSLERPFGRGINFQIEVKSIEPIIQRLSKAKISLFQQPKDNWYRQGSFLLGNREFLVQDPDGYLLRFSQDLGKKKIK